LILRLPTNQLHRTDSSRRQ